MATSRQEFIAKCREEAARVRARICPWTILVRDNHCCPINREERDRAREGLPHKCGRGRPIGVAYIAVYEGNVLIGASATHPRDRFNKHIGFHYALRNGRIIDLERFKAMCEHREIAKLTRKFPQRTQRTLMFMIGQIYGDLLAGKV